VSASAYILANLRNLLKSMHGKQRELSDTRRHRDEASLEFTGADVTKFLQLSALNGLIPQVAHAVEAADMSPQFLYLLLCQAAGQLSTFSADSDPANLPKFQYTNLRATFEGLFLKLDGLLRSVAIEQSVAIPLESRKDGMHLARLEDERLPRCTHFILAVKSEVPEKKTADELPALAKIASWDEINNIIQAATPGVPLTVTFRPPPEIPVKPKVVYFLLDITDRYWKDAIQDQTLAIYLPQPFDPSRTKLELMAVPGKKEGSRGR
jgi:type VI secretion system protein ImpJ